MVGIWLVSPSTAVAFRRGSITRSVRNQPMATIRNVEAVVKNQLLSGLISMAGSSRRAASWVRPASNGSRLDGTKKVAENPPDTPANAAAIPASGWRPAA